MVRVAVALLLSLSAHAGEPLTYEDAVERALVSNPALYNAQLQLERTEEDVVGAWGGFDPTFSLSAGWEQSRDVGPAFPGSLLVVRTNRDRWDATATLQARAPTGTSGTLTGSVLGTYTTNRTDDGVVGGFLAPFQRNRVPGSFSLSVTQELLKGVKLSYNLQNVRRARANGVIQELELGRTRQQAIADVARTYWTWVHRVEVARISDEAVAVAEENLRVGEERVSLGQAAPVERTRLEAALVQARTQALDAQNEAGRAADELLVAMGEDPGADLEPASIPGDVPSLELDADSAVEVALKQGFDVGVARARLEQAKLEQSVSKHELWPSLNLTATAGAGTGLFETPEDSGRTVVKAGTTLPVYRILETDQNSLNYGVRGNFSMPLGNRVAASAARRTAVDVAVAEQVVVDTEASTRIAVHQAVRVLASAKAKVELADVNQRLAEETLAAEEALFDAGRALLKDVLEARRSVDEAKGEAMRARTDFRIALVELMRLQGQLGMK